MSILDALRTGFGMLEHLAVPASDSEEAAFASDLARLRRRLLLVTLLAALAINGAWWLLDPLVFSADVVASYADLRLEVTVFFVAGVALLALTPPLPRVTATTAAVSVVGFCALCAYHLAPLGLLGLQYLTPMPLLAVLLGLGGRARLGVIAAIVASTWGAVLVVHGGSLPPGTGGTFASTIAIGLLAHAFGAWLVQLLHTRHVNQQRLHALTADLEGHVDAQARHLRALAQELLAARDGERRWLSQELHDALGQELTAMRHTSDLASLQLRRGLVTEAEETIEDIGTLVTRVHGTLRRILAHMRPEAVEQLGLVEAVRALVDDAGRRGLDASLTLDEVALEELTAPVDVALYRILQEALTNVLRHADARTVTVRLGRVGSTLQLDVVDDGIGLRSEPETGVCHVGLIGIGERARLCGGVASWFEPPSGGLTVHVELPIETA